MDSYRYGCLIFILLLGSCALRLPQLLEEIGEDIIKEYTGVEIEFTPGNEEKID